MSLLYKHQKLQNADAKLILGDKKWDHVTPPLKDLHWLAVSLLLIFKTALLMYKTVNGNGPAYLGDFLEGYACSRQGMRSAYNTMGANHTVYKIISRTELSVCLGLMCGTVYGRMSDCLSPSARLRLLQMLMFLDEH